MITFNIPKSPVCVGLDPSTFTGLVALQNGQVVLQKTLNVPDVKGYDRAHTLGFMLKGHLTALQTRGPVTVFMEGFAYGNRFSLVHMVEVSTLLKNAMLSLGIEWYTVQPSALKKWTTKKGNADKAEMAAAVLSRWGFTPEKVKGVKTDDVVDAYALARMCATYETQYHNPAPVFRG